jgi:acyl dehydratase
MGKRLIDPAELCNLVGHELGVSCWVTIDQRIIDTFGELTRDEQWIHLDVARASLEGGGTIAHGFLTISMMSFMVAEIWEVLGTKRAYNYGFNKLRLPAPVPSGARIRLHETLLRVEEKPDGVLVTRDSRVEVERKDKPAVVAEWVSYLVL